jgi:hypothetical protein
MSEAERGQQAVVTGTVTSSGDEAQGVFPVAAAGNSQTAGPPLTAAELIDTLMGLRAREVLKLHNLPTTDDRTFTEISAERLRAELALKELVGRWKTLHDFYLDLAAEDVAAAMAYQRKPEESPLAYIAETAITLASLNKPTRREKP